MILEAFALLRARPVRKYAEMPVDQLNCDRHVAGDAESGDTPEEAEDQTDAAEKFGGDGKKSEGRGDMHLLCEETHGAAESI